MNKNFRILGRLAQMSVLATFLLAGWNSTVSAKGEGYHMKLNLQACSFSNGIDGPQFNVTAEIINEGKPIDAPMTIWLLYDGVVCDQKGLEKIVNSGGFLFNDLPDGPFFKCGINAPQLPEGTTQVRKTFQFVYTIASTDPVGEGHLFFNGNTADQCGGVAR